MLYSFAIRVWALVTTCPRRTPIEEYCTFFKKKGFYKTNYFHFTYLKYVCFFFQTAHNISKLNNLRHLMIKLNIRNIYDEARLRLFWPSWEIVSQITTGLYQSEEYLSEHQAFDAWFTFTCICTTWSFLYTFLVNP